MGITEEYRRGLDHLRTVTTLLQRIRTEHPTSGLYEAADVQWWWRAPRTTDDLDQLVWCDPSGAPVAAVVATAWRGRTALDPITLPDATPEWIEHVMRRGLEHASAAGLRNVGLEVGDDDDVLPAVLTDAGLVRGPDDLMAETWLTAADRPPVTPLADGYRLTSRAALPDRPHHLIHPVRTPIDPEPRLRQTSLYRADLDLVVLAPDDEVAAFAIFWHDPVSRTGLIEPVRTHEAHQRRGLSRHLLTVGIEKLAAAGAERIKICHHLDNPASSTLYRSLGFQQVRTTADYARPQHD